MPIRREAGWLIFGIADKTREIVGIDEAVLFQTMDRIANAVSDSCEPQIVPDIEPYTVEGKTVIVVTVAPEPRRPYYLKSRGKDRGTYIRVGATTRPASFDKIKELENWKVLKNTGNGYLASNAFVLLTSDYFQFSKTQCAVFKGTNRSVFLDKREYTAIHY